MASGLVMNEQVYPERQNSENYNTCAALMRVESISNEFCELVPEISYSPSKKTYIEELERRTSKELKRFPMKPENPIYTHDTKCEVEVRGLLQGVYPQRKSWRDLVLDIPEDLSNNTIGMTTTSLVIKSDIPIHTSWATSDLLIILVLLNWLPSRQGNVYKVLYRWANQMWNKVISHLEGWKTPFKPLSLETDENGRLEEMFVQETDTDIDTIPINDLGVDKVHEDEPRTPLPPASPKATTVGCENICLGIVIPDPDDELVSLFAAWHLHTPTTESPSSRALSSSSLISPNSCTTPMSLC